MGYLRKVAILDCIGFDLQQTDRPMQVRFAKCLVHDDGRIERQWGGDKLLCHRVNIHPRDDIDTVMAKECEQICAMGYDPPTPRMIERIKAHCAVEWDGQFTDEMPMLPAPQELELVTPFMPDTVAVGV